MHAGSGTWFRPKHPWAARGSVMRRTVEGRPFRTWASRGEIHRVECGRHAQAQQAKPGKGERLVGDAEARAGTCVSGPVAVRMAVATWSAASRLSWLVLWLGVATLRSYRDGCPVPAGRPWRGRVPVRRAT